VGRITAFGRQRGKVQGRADFTGIAHSPAPRPGASTPRLLASIAIPMEQLVFELVPPEPPSLANFLPGRNAEAVAALEQFASGQATETGLFLWGATGAGKTHLLRAAIASAAARGIAASYIGDPGTLVATDPETLGAQSIVAVDAIDAAGAPAQARLFTLFNALQAAGHRFVGAANVPPAAVNVREDLRTRLGSCLVYEVAPLADADKPAALLSYARARGFALPDEVIGYLLAHGRRDMPALLAALSALERHSLATRRPITVPMLRGWLQQDIALS
jgi:DnaA family protein